MEHKQFTPEELEAKLKELGIDYTLHKHEAAFNMQELKEKVKLNKAPYIKNIFSKDKKGDCYLISAHVDTVVGKAFYKKVGTTYNNCRMADGTTLKETLGVEAGSVTPFGLINDPEKKKVKHFVFDQNLLNEEYLAFHPLVNTSTVELKRTDFFKFLESLGRTYTSLDLSEVEEKVEKKEEKPKVVEEKKSDSSETKLAIAAKKNEDFSLWYTDVLKKGELIEYYEISGCYILRPYAYGIWESIQKMCDKRFGDVIIPFFFKVIVRSRKQLLPIVRHRESLVQGKGTR
jgi:prolyl-tRNA synthetase